MENKVIAVNGVSFTITENDTVPKSSKGKPAVYLPLYQQMPVGASVTLGDNKAKGFYKAVLDAVGKGCVQLHQLGGGQTKVFKVK